MRVTVDPKKCAGYASCEIIAPEVFALDDENVARVLDEQPPTTMRQRLEKAVRDCPAGAITLADG